MCKSRDPFFYTGVIVRARWRASLRDARCARYDNEYDTQKIVFNNHNDLSVYIQLT